MPLTQAETVGLAVVLLGIIYAAAWLIRRHVPLLGSLFLPASIIAGFLVLGLGEQGLGRLTGGGGLFPSSITNVWHATPGLMISVVFAAVMIGKALPSAGGLWRAAAPHALMGAFLSFGQFALGGLAVLLVLGPVFGLPPQAGALIEMTFAGGHGTVAGMAEMLEAEGAGDLVDLGLGMATLAMITGIVAGAALVRWAVGNPRIPLARKTPLRAAENLDLNTAPAPAADIEAAESNGGHAAVIAFAAICLAIGAAVLILTAAKRLAALAGTDLLDGFPLFPVAMVGGFLVQLAAARTGLARHIDKPAVDGIAAIALDVLLICAIGTMSLAAIGANLPALLIFTVLGVIWSTAALLWFGPRFHRKDWFEHAVADFGQSQGNVANGFVLAEMADPDRRTTTATDYGYKQLPYEPFLGGGFITALSAPFITEIGLVPFTLASIVAAAFFGWWGMTRR